MNSIYFKIDISIIFTSLLLILQVGDTTVFFTVFISTGDTIGGTNDGGSFLGRVILFRLRTTKCMASLNSESESAPSFVTSDSSLINCKYLIKEKNWF